MTEVVLHAPDLPAKAAELRLAAKRLQARVVEAADRAVQESYRPALVALTPEYMPSGYVPELTASLRVSTSVSFARSPGVNVRVFAPLGRGGGRELRSLEQGVLSHPLFGNRSHWYRKKVRRGFARAALKSTSPVIRKEIDDELDEIARELAT